MSEGVLTKDQLEVISEAAIRMHQEQSKREKIIKRDKYYGNIKRLLKHYRQLKSYAGNMQTMVSRFEDLQNAFGFGEVEFPVSLSKHKNKTVIFMDYIDSNLEAYKKLCENGTEEEQRRWKIIHDMYLSEQPLTAKQVAEKYFITKSRPYKEVAKACETLVVLFFGVDGMDTFLE